MTHKTTYTDISPIIDLKPYALGIMDALDSWVLPAIDTDLDDCGLTEIFNAAYGIVEDEIYAPLSNLDGGDEELNETIDGVIANTSKLHATLQGLADYEDAEGSVADACFESAIESVTDFQTELAERLDEASA